MFTIVQRRVRSERPVAVFINRYGADDGAVVLDGYGIARLLPATAEGRRGVIRMSAVGNWALDGAYIVGDLVNTAIAALTRFARCGGVDFQVEYRSWLALASGWGYHGGGEAVIPFGQCGWRCVGPFAADVGVGSTDQYAIIVNVDLSAGSRLAAQGRRAVVGDAVVM